MSYDYYFSAKHKNYAERYLLLTYNVVRPVTCIQGKEYSEMIEQGNTPLTNHFGDLVKVHTGEYEGDINKLLRVKI